jgi:2-polyprenyl-3-methyl-5-hydroxy-6-metoxy-1,4-benzoquinol methylase
MLSNVKGIASAEIAHSLPIYCPESIDLKESTERFLALASRPNAYKGPDIAALYYNRFVEIAAPYRINVKGKRVVDFGCGQARPLGLAILHHLSGADSVLAIDLQDISDQAAVSLNAATTVLSALSGTLTFDFNALGGNWDTLRMRSTEYDLPKLLANDLIGGMPGRVNFRQDYFQSLAPSDRRFDILVSNSVFEHVHGVPEVLASMRESVSSDGAIYIAIDYHDHRVYARGSSASRWQYLMDGDDDNGDINCIRHTAFLELINEAGFDVVQCRREEATPTPAELAKFLPENRFMSQVDINTLAAHILMKPKRRKHRLISMFRR